MSEECSGGKNDAFNLHIFGWCELNGCRDVQFFFPPAMNIYK